MISVVATMDLPFHWQQTILLPADASAVFRHLDDFERLGAHMLRSSPMMAGSSMRYEFDAARGRGRGARVFLRGSVFGFDLRVDEEVSDYAPPLRKAWQTIGLPKLLVIGEYRMGFELTPLASGCQLRVFIDYELPDQGLPRLLGRLAGPAYARWCVNSMIEDARREFVHSS